MKQAVCSACQGEEAGIAGAQAIRNSRLYGGQEIRNCPEKKIVVPGAYNIAWRLVDNQLVIDFSINFEQPVRVPFTPELRFPITPNAFDNQLKFSASLFLIDKPSDGEQ